MIMQLKKNWQNRHKMHCKHSHGMLDGFTHKNRHAKDCKGVKILLRRTLKA